MLVLIDAVAVALLLRRDPRPGVVMAAVVMIVDVAANSYAWFAVGAACQAAFLGFVLGAAPLVWINAAMARRPPTG